MRNARGVKTKQPKSHILGPNQVCDADRLATLLYLSWLPIRQGEVCKPPLNTASEIENDPQTL